MISLNHNRQKTCLYAGKLTNHKLILLSPPQEHLDHASVTATLKLTNTKKLLVPSQTQRQLSIGTSSKFPYINLYNNLRYIKRGCIEDKSAMTSGSVPSKDLYGVTVTHSVCTFQNGTLCNGKIEAYDTSLELQTQNVRKLQCYICDTPAGNTDSSHECYTVPSTAKVNSTIFDF